MVEVWWKYSGVLRNVRECGGILRSVEEWWNVVEVAECWEVVVIWLKWIKKECAFVLHTLIYNFLASYGSLKDDDPNRYLIDLST